MSIILIRYERLPMVCSPHWVFSNLFHPQLPPPPSMMPAYDFRTNISFLPLVCCQLKSHVLLYLVCPTSRYLPIKSPVLCLPPPPAAQVYCMYCILATPQRMLYVLYLGCPQRMLLSVPSFNLSVS